MAVKVGDKFHSVIADAKVEFEVTKINGDLCEAVATENNLDYIGTVKGFTVQEVQDAKSAVAFWTKYHRQQKQFYKTIEPGEVYHYHNGFGCFVRCEVNGEKKLKAIALVGAWQDHDMPRRTRFGYESIPYHAQKVLDGELCTPNQSCIYELHQDKFDVDPRTMDPINLTLPEPTEEERLEAEGWTVIAEIEELIAACRRQQGMTAAQTVDALKKALA